MCWLPLGNHHFESKVLAQPRASCYCTPSTLFSGAHRGQTMLGNHVSVNGHLTGRHRDAATEILPCSAPKLLQECQGSSQLQVHRASSLQPILGLLFSDTVSLQPSPNREAPKEMSKAIIPVNTRNLQSPFLNSPDTARLPLALLLHPLSLNKQKPIAKQGRKWEKNKMLPKVTAGCSLC